VVDHINNKETSGMDRQIACFHVRHFEIVLVRLTDPSLNGRPVAITTPHRSRAFVIDASDEALDAAVSPGMSMEDARRTCPSIHFVRSSAARLGRGHRCLTDILKHVAPVYEPWGHGRVYADFTGAFRLFGATRDVAHRIRRDLLALHGFAPAVGVGSNKLVTHVASNVTGEASLVDIQPGDERRFLSPLSPRVLPQAARASWRSVFDVLADLNLTTLGTIATLTVPQLRVAVGRAGDRLHQWANGVDETPVRSPAYWDGLTVAHRVNAEERDHSRLLGALRGALEALCCELRRSHKACRALHVTVVYSDDQETTCRYRPDSPSPWDADLYPGLEAVFLRRAPRRVQIREIIVRAEAAAAHVRQLNLLASPARAADTARRQALVLAIDRIRDRCGPEAVRWGGVPCAAGRI
jgi:DNA polymerase IV